MSSILKGLNEGYFSRSEQDQQNAMDTRRSSDLSSERNAGLDEPDELPITPPETRNGVYEYNVPAGQEDIAQEIGLQSHRGHWVSRIPIQRANFQFGRPQFHEIPSQGVTEGVNDPHTFKCIFLFGPMGAGKSTVARPLLSHTGLRSVNLDNFNEMFVKKGQVPTGHLSPDQLEKSWQLTQTQQQNFIDGRLGVIIDGSGRNPDTAISVIEKLAPLGYEFMMIFVNVSEATSIARQQSRAEKQQQQWGVGRQVDPTLAKNTYAQVQKNLAKYSAYFGPQRFVYVDNENTPNLTQATKKVDAFLRSPVRQPEAIKWIQAQKGGQQVAQQQQKLATAQDRQQQALKQYNPMNPKFAKQESLEHGVTEGSDELYGLRVGDTVKAVINGKRVQGDVIDIFPETQQVELLLRGAYAGKTITVDVQDTESMMEASTLNRAVDSKGRTQPQWIELVMKKFPDARIAQGKGPFSKTTAMLSDGRRLVWAPVIPDSIKAASTKGIAEKSPYDFIKPGAMVKFGMWNKPQEHRTGQVVKMADGIVTVTIDGGKTVDLYLGNKSLSISPVSADQQGIAEGSKEQEYGPEWDEKVKRLGQMAKQGERKTVWDPVKRVYKTVPVQQSAIKEGLGELGENLNKWFKEKWVRFGPDGKIRGDCARGDDSEGKPKCLPQSKAQNLGKKGRASAAARKRREDPNPERSGKAINVATKKKSSEGMAEGSKEKTQGIALSKAYKKDFDNKKPGQDRAETALTGTYSKTGKPGGELKKKGVAEGDDIQYHQTSGTKAGHTISSRKLSNKPQASKSDVTLQSGSMHHRGKSYNFPKGTLFAQLPGGIFAKHPSVPETAPGYGHLIRRSEDNIRAIHNALNGEQGVAEDQLDELKCWSGYTRVQGVPAGAPGSCKKKTNEEQEHKCPHCGGEMVSEELMNEKKDACYYKVKSRYKVWPSAYASGALVKCRKSGADSWGNGGKKNESIEEGSEQQWTVTVGSKTGGTSHTMTFTGTKEQAIKKAVARFGTSKNPVVNAVPAKQGVAEEQLDEKWTKKYKDSINCSNPKGFSQKAHCAGKQKNESAIMKGLK